MQQYGFVIKVSDLLHNPWSSDIVNFSGKKTTQLSGLSNDGISWKVRLRSLNDSDISVVIEELNLELNLDCDRCWVQYKKNINLEEIDGKFTTNIDDWYHEDYVYPINVKDLNIDIEDFIVHSVSLEQDIVNYCENCQKIIDQLSEDEDIDLYENDEKNFWRASFIIK